MALRARPVPGLLSPTRYLRYHALRKGLFGGSRGWMVLGAVVYAPRVLRRLFGRNEEVVATERLVKGQGVMVQPLHGLSRAQQKAVWREVKRSR